MHRGHKKRAAAMDAPALTFLPYLSLECPYHHQEDQSDQGSQEDPQEDPPVENELSVVISPLWLSEPPIPNETCATAGPAVRAIITAIRAATTNNRMLRLIKRHLLYFTKGWG